MLRFGQGDTMFNAYVIEVTDQAAGIVSRIGRGFRFHSAAPKFNSLDGRVFRTPDEAARVARALAGRAKQGKCA